MELPLGVYERSAGSYQAKVKLGDHRYGATFNSVDAANAWLKAMRNAHKFGKDLPEPSEFTTAKALTIEEIYERVWNKRWSSGKSGKDGSPGNALRFVTWCGTGMSAADALAEDNILAFLELRKSAGNSDSTLKHYKAALSPLIREALRLKLINVAPEFPRLKAGKVRMRILTEKEEEAMLTVLRQWGYNQTASLFEFLLDTGIRPGEAHKLKWEDFEATKVHLEHDITKNSTRRTLALTKRAQNACASMRQCALTGPWTWAHPKLRETRSIVEKLREHFGWGDDFVVYTLRHTCASRLVQRGVDLYRVQIWMGHSNSSMTQRYAKFAPKHMDELAGVLENG